MDGDGNGWSFDSDGTRYWGIYGAAGLLLHTVTAAGLEVLLQHRALWSHQGGTWSLPGGARDSHESPTAAALREANEEAGIRAEDLTVLDTVVTASSESGWTYTTVIASIPTKPVTEANHETTELRWVPVEAVSELPLHPGFAQSWDEIRTRLA